MSFLCLNTTVIHKNYRNSREIIELARLFAMPPSSGEETEEDSIVSIMVDPDKCQRRTGFKPILVKSANRREESTRIRAIVKNLLEGDWFGKPIKPLTAKEIAIFYPLMFQRDKSILQGLIQGLADLELVILLSNSDDYTARTRVATPGIKIQTIHSAKGLQYRALVLLWADHLPKQFQDTDEQEDRRLMYVALTRPEDFIVISAFGSSPFINEIENFREVEFA